MSIGLDAVPENVALGTNENFPRCYLYSVVGHVQ